MENKWIYTKEIGGEDSLNNYYIHKIDSDGRSQVISENQTEVQAGNLCRAHNKVVDKIKTISTLSDGQRQAAGLANMYGGGFNV